MFLFTFYISLCLKMVSWLLSKIARNWNNNEQRHEQSFILFCIRNVVNVAYFSSSNNHWNSNLIELFFWCFVTFDIKKMSKLYFFMWKIERKLSNECININMMNTTSLFIIVNVYGTEVILAHIDAYMRIRVFSIHHRGNLCLDLRE